MKQRLQKIGSTVTRNELKKVRGSGVTDPRGEHCCGLTADGYCPKNLRSGYMCCGTGDCVLGDQCCDAVPNRSRGYCEHRSDCNSYDGSMKNIL